MAVVKTERTQAAAARKNIDFFDFCLSTIFLRRTTTIQRQFNPSDLKNDRLYSEQGRAEKFRDPSQLLGFTDPGPKVVGFGGGLGT